jgi:hypothetical protein
LTTTTSSDQDGEVVGTQGFYLLAQQQESISRAVAAISDSRSLIDQVRGILTLVCRIDADAAFGVLKRRSQVTNTKLRAVAEQLLADIRLLEYTVSCLRERPPTSSSSQHTNESTGHSSTDPRSTHLCRRCEDRVTSFAGQVPGAV